MGCDQMVDIPVGSKITEVADARIGTHALYILVVPEWEGIVVSVGEDDRVALVLKRHQIVAAEVAAGVTA